MDAFEVLASPARRLVLELLADGDRTAGDLTAAVVHRFGLTQPAVSRHLAVLREAGVVDARATGTRRVYRLIPGSLGATHDWLARREVFWTQRLDALETELARGARARRQPPAGPEISAPEIRAPEINAREIRAPEIRAPEINAREINAREVSARERSGGRRAG